MKVLVVTTEYRTGASGGVESVVDFLLESLRRLTDWDVEVASLRMSRRAEESWRLVNPSSWLNRPRAATRTVDGVVVHDIGSAFAEVEACRFLPRKCLDPLLDRADVVVVVSGTPAPANAVRRVGPRTVLQVATLVKLERERKNAQLKGAARLFRNITTALTSRLDEAGLKAPAVVLVENDLMLRECEQRGINGVQLCPPGVDTDLYSPAETVVLRPYVLMVARLGDARKNVSGLIRAYARARTMHGVKQDLVLAGLSAPSNDDLRLIQELELQSSVVVRSPVSQAELVDLYQGADLFASASFEEGLGLTFIEAMACGIPVVTTDTAGGVFVLADSGAGAVVPHGDGLMERLAVEIARWCHDEELRRSAGYVARLRALEVFSEAVTSQKFVDAIIGVGLADLARSLHGRA